MNLTYKNDPKLKALHVAQAKRHVKQDMLRKGTYSTYVGNKLKGCSVGCFAREIDLYTTRFHEVIADARGLPLWLIYLQDGMFEGLPQSESVKFHVELAEAIEVGVNLKAVPRQLLNARIDRMLALLYAQLHDIEHPDVRKVAFQIIEALEVVRKSKLTIGSKHYQKMLKELSSKFYRVPGCLDDSSIEMLISVRAAWYVVTELDVSGSAAQAAKAAKYAATSKVCGKSTDLQDEVADTAEENAWMQERDALFKALREVKK